MAKTIDSSKGEKVLDVQNINASINLLDKAIDAKALRKLGADMKKYEDITRKTSNIKKNLEKFSGAIDDLSGIDADSAEALSNLSNAIGGLSDPEEIKAFAKGVKEIDKISGKISELANVEALGSIGEVGASMKHFADMKKVKAFKKGVDEVFQITGKIAQIASAGAGKSREEIVVDPKTGNQKIIKSKGTGTLGDLASSIDSISNEGKIKRFKKGVNSLMSAYGQINTISKAAGSSISKLAEGMTIMGDMRKIVKFKLGVTALTFLIHDISELEEVGTTAIANISSAMTNISSAKLIVKFTLGLKILNELIRDDLIELSGISAEGVADLAESMTNISNPIMVAKFALGIKAIRHLVLGDVAKINEINKDGGGLTALSQSMAAIANVKRIVLFNWGIKMIARNVDFLERIGEAGAGEELNKIAMSMAAISQPLLVMKFKLGVKLISGSADTLRMIDDSLKTTKEGERGGLQQLSEMIKNYSSASRILKFTWGVKRISKILPQIEKFGNVKWEGMRTLLKFTTPSNIMGISKFTKIIKKMSSEKYIEATNTFIRQIKKLGEDDVVKSMNNLSESSGLKVMSKIIKNFPGPIRMTLFISSLNRLYKHRDKLASLSEMGVDIYKLAAGPLERVAGFAGRGVARVSGGITNAGINIGGHVLGAGATLGAGVFRGMGSAVGGIGGGLASGIARGSGGALRGLGSLFGGLGRGAGSAAGGIGSGLGSLLGGLGVGTGYAAGGLGRGAGSAAGGIGSGAGSMLGGLASIFGKRAGSREDVMDDLGKAGAASSEGRTRRQLTRIERNTNQIKRKLGVKINDTTTTGSSDSTLVGAETGTSSKAEGIGFGYSMILSAVAAGIGVWLAKEHPMLGRAVKYFTTFARWVKRAFGGLDLVAKSGAAVAKFSGKALVKPLMKVAGSFIKKIPIIGGAAGLVFAIDRFMDGDVSGGVMELASGIASFFPGPGTLISILLDGLLIAKDLKNTKPEQSSKNSLGNKKANIKLGGGKPLEMTFSAENIQDAVMEGYSDEQIVLAAKQKYAMSGNSSSKIDEIKEMLKQSHNQLRSDINNQGNKTDTITDTSNPKAKYTMAFGVN